MEICFPMHVMLIVEMLVFVSPPYPPPMMTPILLPLLLLQDKWINQN